MSLEKILEKIDQETQQEVGAILEEARKKAETIKKDAEQKARQQAETILKQAEVEARLEASRILTQAQLQKRMELLRTKRELIDRVLRAALSQEKLKKARLKKEIVSRQGVRKETLPYDRILAELGHEVENNILEWLKI
jgi:vacuolar-type H+-ATPase subunit E/Vma4